MGRLGLESVVVRVRNINQGTVCAGQGRYARGMAEHIRSDDTVVITQPLDDLVEWLASFAADGADRDKIRSGVVTDVTMDGADLRVELIIP